MVVLGRRGFINAFIASAIGLLSQCNRRDTVSMDQPLRLAIQCEIRANTLLVHYGVQNQANLDVYLLNRLHDLGYKISPDLAYVELDRQKRLVYIYKKVPDIPPGVSPTMPISPFVTPLRAGARFDEIVHISLPIHECHAYPKIDPHQQQGRSAVYHGLYFALQYYWSVPGMKERNDVVNGVPVIIPVSPPGTKLNPGILSSSVVSLDVPVIEE
jgi:hypothetical protein